MAQALVSLGGFIDSVHLVLLAYILSFRMALLTIFSYVVLYKLQITLFWQLKTRQLSTLGKWSLSFSEDTSVSSLGLQVDSIVHYEVSTTVIASLRTSRSGSNVSF